MARLRLRELMLLRLRLIPPEALCMPWLLLMKEEMDDKDDVLESIAQAISAACSNIVDSESATTIPSEKGNK
jgi:hypothetical protein